MLSGSSEVKVATNFKSHSLDLNDSPFNQIEQTIKPLEHMFYNIALSKAPKSRILSKPK